MNSAEFVTPYRRSVPEHELHRGPVVAGMETARFWDNAYGEVLHDRLSSGKPVNVDQYNDRSYPLFCLDELPYLPTAINNAAISLDEKHRLLGDMTFHVMNNAMHPLWFPLFEDQNLIDNPTERLRYISYSQSLIALHGLSYYVQREVLAGKRSGYAYFDTEHEYQRKYTEGLTNELDAGLVLLEAIKPYPDLTVVPGPRQFESDGKRNVPYAADFVVVSTENKAVGVQVKSFISSQDQIEDYDRSRIMLIDGSVDLGNSRVARTKQESSHTRKVSWGGVLSAHFARKISFQGKHGLGANLDPNKKRQFIQLQMRAHGPTQHMHNDFAQATSTIRDRLKHALFSVPEPRKETFIDLATPRPKAPASRAALRP